MAYNHPREIDDFDDLAIDREPALNRSPTEIALLKDGDGPRDWRQERRWGFFGPHFLVFTVLDRRSPSSMAKQRDFELSYDGEDWWLRDADGSSRERLKKESVARLVPAEFSDWVEAQESRVLPLSLSA